MVLSLNDEMATSDLISILLEEALANKMSDVYILYKRYDIPSIVKLAIDGEYVTILSSFKTEEVIQYIIRESFNNYKNLNSASALRSLCVHEEIYGKLKQRINNTWYDVKVACKSDSSNMRIRFSILQRIGNHSFPESLLPITASLQSSELYCEEEQIPILLKGSIDAIEECAGKIRNAQRKQHFARNEAEIAIEYAKVAQNEADEACKASAKLGHRKEAIEKLQKSEEKMADALVRAVEAQKKSVESQMALNEVQQYQLEQQKKLIELSKGLLALGTINKAANDKVIKALKDTLKGASEVDLDDFTRAELESVLQQLSEQQDIFYRLDKLDENYVKMAEVIRENRKCLSGMQTVIAEHDELIERMSESVKKFSVEYAEKSISIQQVSSEEVDKAQIEATALKEELATLKDELCKTKSKTFFGISMTVSILALFVSFITLVQSLL